MKPRLRKYGQHWVCYGSGVRQYGDNPKHAYDRWLAVVEFSRRKR